MKLKTLKLKWAVKVKPFFILCCQTAEDLVLKLGEQQVQSTHMLPTSDSVVKERRRDHNNQQLH